MPYSVVKDESSCSASKPWAVKKKGGSKVYGCHATKTEAEKQQAALYANTEDAAAAMAVAEFVRVNRRPENLPKLAVNGTQVALTTIEDVDLLEIGMNFPASTGEVSFSFAHLSSAVAAGADPVIPRPRIKLGHTDPRYNDSHTYDGDPNFGFVENMKLSSDGGKITADLVDVPVWLSTVMPVAFPSRSIEGWFNYTGPNQKDYEFVVTALALLGVCWPGVMSLEDLPRIAEMYGEEMPDYVTVQEGE